MLANKQADKRVTQHPMEHKISTHCVMKWSEILSRKKVASSVLALADKVYIILLHDCSSMISQAYGLEQKKTQRPAFGIGKSRAKRWTWRFLNGMIPKSQDIQEPLFATAYLNLSLGMITIGLGKGRTLFARLHPSLNQSSTTGLNCFKPRKMPLILSQDSGFCGMMLNLHASKREAGWQS